MIKLKNLTSKLFDYCDKALALKLKPPIFGNNNSGINFLGYRVSKYHISLSSKARRRFKKKITILTKLFYENQISEVTYSIRALALLSFVEKADSFKMRNKFFTSRVNVLRAPTA